MYSSLLNLKGIVCAFVVLAVCFSGNSQAQQSKNSSTNSNQINGKQVYRNIKKLYEGKTRTSQSSKVKSVAEDQEKRYTYEMRQLVDPATGIIPPDIREKETRFSSKIAIGDDSQKSLEIAAKSAKSGNFSFWKNRGPFNVGGRTRALAIDRTNENVILAGGSSGGMWRSENGGESWRKVTRNFQNPSVTAIIQDPRPGKSFIWYYTSGERRGSASDGGGAFYQGTGIFKSQDGGRTWEKLRNTDDNDPAAFGPLDLINSIAIHPENGDIYVGTITGIHRSQDGGNTFIEVLAGDFDTYAEVEITTTGQIYATLDFDSDPNSGFFTSVDGDTWTDITPEFLAEEHQRTVIGSDPTNGNVVYFFTADANRNAPQRAYLYKYDSAAEENWTDLTVNLPTNFGSRGGTFNVQGGYDLVVKVSPADSNLIFVGGTNLYRSTTGFTTPSAPDSWIGGYTSSNGEIFALYTDHHPDQHALVFYPSNPNKVLSGHDGGVSVTEDITATNPQEPVTWTSLSNGYLTTQPYHVSFDPEPNSDDLIAGFQDNSTWYTNSTDGTAPWEDLFGGDGSYSAIADNGSTRYVSSQLGNIIRFNYNEEGENIGFTRITPAGATGFGFIAPFVLDPNNDNIMYLPAGDRIWRNNNLDEVPLSNNAAATVNWVNLSNSATLDGAPIVSLDVSKYPIANRLYYGTASGVVYRMDNANVDGQEALDITTGKELPPGFVTDVNVDPSNADRVIITFSNYRIPSLFITEDGGETWTDISGNLEENIDGSGNGPSVRSTAFLGSSTGRLGARLQRIFAGTSTGLYSTRRLDGQNTVWRKENIVIGNSVVMEVGTRKDGFIAAASHGNGLFSARFPVVNELPEPSLTVSYLLEDITVDINEIEDFDVTVEDLFVNSNGGAISIELQNTNPGLVTATLDDDTISIAFAEGAEVGDQATIVLVATSGNEQVAEGFTINISELPIYNQNGVQTSAIISQNNALDISGAIVQVGDDFVVPEGTTWTIERILAFGTANDAPVLDNATVVIYTNENGTPGEEVFNSGELTPISEPNDTNINLLLPQAITLENGTYWISIYANIDSGRWNWAAQNGGIDSESHLRDIQDVFGAGATNWTPLSLLGIGPIDQIFDLYGVISGGDTDAGTSSSSPLTTLDASSGTTVVFPNPSTGIFTFNLKDFKPNERVSMTVYNIAGTRIYQRNDLRSQFQWDASGFTNGFYFVEIQGESGIERNFKLLLQQ